MNPCGEVAFRKPVIFIHFTKVVVGLLLRVIRSGCNESSETTPGKSERSFG
jgi:hypothetical protein